MIKFQKKKSFYMVLTGLIISLFFTANLIYRFIKSPSTLGEFLLMYSAFSSLGFISYLLLHGRNSKIYELKDHMDRTNKALVSVFLIIVVAILLTLRSALYTKSLSYYVLISLGAGIIGIQIIIAKNITKKEASKIFAQIIALAVIIRLSSFLINPYIFGADSYWHFNAYRDIISANHLLPKTGHYYYYPSSHLLASFSQIIAGPFTFVSSLSLLILSLVAIPAIYLLGTEISDERAGLMASLFLTVSSFHIFGSVNHAPMTIGFSLVIMGMYILLKFNKYDKLGEYVRVLVLFWLSVIFVFFVHPVTSLTFGFILGANVLAVYFMIYRRNNKRGFTPFLSYFIAFVAYLMFVHFSLFRNIVEVLFISGEASPLPAIQFIGISYRVLLESSLSYLGTTSLIIFGVFGMLKWLEKKDVKKMTILLSLSVLYLLPFYSFLSGSGGLDPGRFLVFIEVLLVLPAGAGFIYLSSNSINKKYLTLSLLILILISFSSVSSYITWDGNTVFKDEVEIPLGFVTQSTLAVHPFVEKLSILKTVYMDDRTHLYINNAERGILTLNRKAESISYSALENEGYFLVNNLVLEMKMWGKESEKEDFFRRLENGDKIYDNRNVQVFER